MISFKIRGDLVIGRFAGLFFLRMVKNDLRKGVFNLVRSSAFDQQTFLQQGANQFQGMLIIHLAFFYALHYAFRFVIAIQHLFFRMADLLVISGGNCFKRSVKRRQLSG